MPQTPSNAPEAHKDEFLFSAEAARLIGVSRQTLYKYEEQGLISAYRTPGGHRRFIRSEVEALLTRGDAA